ncbi:hypothetical protein RI054_45g154410 [Pseudoscourfieldia marina]
MSMMMCASARVAPPGEPWDVWTCGCGSLKLSINERPYIACMECYCDDCVRRMRIVKKHYEKPEGASLNKFSPGGGYLMVNASSRSMTFVKGKEHIGYFRATVCFRDKRTGKVIPMDAWKDHALEPEPFYRPKEQGVKDSAVGTRSTLNVYTKCCGSMMCHIPEAHPWAVEVNPNGLERWSFDKLKAPDGNTPVIFGSYGSTRSLTGVPLPDAKPPIPPDVCGPCRFQLNRGFLGVPLFGGVAGDGLAKWFGDTKEPLLKLPKAGVPSYMGIPIDYIDDAALLVPQ